MLAVCDFFMSPHQATAVRFPQRALTVFLASQLLVLFAVVICRTLETKAQHMSLRAWLSTTAACLLTLQTMALGRLAWPLFVRWAMLSDAVTGCCCDDAENNVCSHQVCWILSLLDMCSCWCWMCRCCPHAQCRLSPYLQTV